VRRGERDEGKVGQFLEGEESHRENYVNAVGTNGQGELQCNNSYDCSVI